MWFFKALLTWWNSKTIGTAWYTYRKGEKVGKTSKAMSTIRNATASAAGLSMMAILKPPACRRNGTAGCTTPVTCRPQRVSATQKLEKPHLANQTGSLNAYFPPGSLNSGGQRPAVTGDYEAWQPE